MSSHGKEFPELDGVGCVGVRNLIANDGVAQFRHQVHKGLSMTSRKGNVAGAAAGLDRNGRERPELEVVGLGDGIDVNLVSAKVWDEDEGTGRIEKGLVSVRGILSLRIGAAMRQLVLL